MKKQSLAFLLSIFVLFVFQTSCNKTKQVPKQPETSSGTAILITGAAARIPQEAALLEQLYKTGQLNDVVFIGGASSGALNAVMLNGILSKKISWKQYIRWLSKITNKDIYKKGENRLPEDTSPLRKYLTQICNDSLGYFKMKDLPKTTAISITELNLINLPKKNYRLSNKKINSESDPNLDLIDVLMASTAFPVVFPEQRIKNISSSLPNKSFVDGGLSEDHVPYKGLIDFINYRKKSVKKVIVVSRKSDQEPDISEELQTLGITDDGWFDKSGISLDEILHKGFIKGLKAFKNEEPLLAEKTDIYIPDFNDRFLLLNFNNLEKQYLTTKNWAQKNSPVPLNLYLEKNE